MGDALRQVEAQQGCVLVLDEADKALGGAHNSQGDSGVTRRIFGQLLSWLNDKQDRTFVIMTMNRIDNLPPELLRAGRFDKVFYTDLPTEVERDAILKIHLKKRGIDFENLNIEEKDWQAVISNTEGFVGSELEEIVRDSRYRALDNRDDATPTFQELQEAIADTVPMITLDAEGVQAIREFCQKRATNVSSQTTRKRVRKTKARSLEIES
jgi:SpoVK/Ycf46/Vps4 family AAA+-type ATPase